MLRVTSDVRDRLAELAIGAIVREYAESTPTRQEMEAKAAEAKHILRELSGYDPTEEEERAARAELQRRIEAIQ
jgi:hypothetical protein